MTARSCLALLAAALLLAGCGASDAGEGTGTSSSDTSSPTGQASASGQPRARASVPDVITATAAPTPSGDGLRPAPEEAFDDRPDAYDRGCHTEQGTEVRSCDYGAEDSGTTIALVGDSKALQWVSALDALGREHDWHVVTMTRSTCAWADAYVSSDQKPDTECHEWGTRAKEEVLELGPDLVVTSLGHNMAATSPTATTFSASGLVDGLVSRWDELADAGIPVAALTDTPTVDRGGNVPECVAKHRDDTDACILDSAEGMGTPAMRAAAERARAATLVDLTDVVCPGGTCRPVFGNVLVQRDGSHLTDTFVRAAAPALEAPLRDLVTGSP